MPYSNLQAARSHVEKLMDIAVTLADYTQTSGLADQIPSYLARTLDLDNITLAVLQTKAGESAAEILLLNSSGTLAADDAAAALPRHILDLHRQSSRPNDAPALRISGSAHESGFADIPLPDLPAFSHAAVFSRSIDEETQLLLVVHQAADDPRLSSFQLDAFNHIASQLAKLLRCMFAWQAQPDILGAPFDRLTEREWMVLRGLNSEDGEKQLADRLSLSPHTLHSHIKSIYRKIGVQGRLPLLLRLNAALRDFRASTLQPSAVPVEPAPRSRQNRPVAFAV